MNKRILKKLSKRSVEILAHVKGYRETQFYPADYDDCSTYDVLKGTPMFSYQTSYEYNEWESEAAFAVLMKFIYWELCEICTETGDLISSPTFKNRGDVIRKAKDYVMKMGDWN
ncbi:MULTISPECIES: hypothetical protein [Acinetobacter]|uniref:hypothetical protein n=1 Tax=Acinetobacter TaxID=469 RepID=UPI00027894EC|nr:MULTISPECIES: hypothetical protein [Acinetobacter]EJP41534.1 hypothetical protein ACIN5032_1108 [Acinetobacter baumannii OIFC032]OTR94190.1 hypothetical protein CAT25_19435 [Acinetobacter pittii]TLT61731.1 hypothetical protein FD887_15305 [Acinetobacter baumannii]SMD57729.1 Uncharacterised protein [Acinetobacter baumannii]